MVMLAMDVTSFLSVTGCIAHSRMPVLSSTSIWRHAGSGFILARIERRIGSDYEAGILAYWAEISYSYAAGEQDNGECFSDPDKNKQPSSLPGGRLFLPHE